MAKKKRLTVQALRKKLLTDPAPELKIKCKDATMEEAQAISKDLRAVAYAVGNCLGLAANQIGYTKNVIIFRSNLTDPFIMMVNPKIVKGMDPRKFREHCLSYPGRSKVVKANNLINVKHIGGLAYVGGISARVIAHEIKHLKGRCPV